MARSSSGEGFPSTGSGGPTLAGGEQPPGHGGTPSIEATAASLAAALHETHPVSSDGRETPSGDIAPDVTNAPDYEDWGAEGSRSSSLDVFDFEADNPAALPGVEAGYTGPTLDSAPEVQFSESFREAVKAQNIEDARRAALSPEERATEDHARAESAARFYADLANRDPEYFEASGARDRMSPMEQALFDDINQQEASEELSDSPDMQIGIDDKGVYNENLAQKQIAKLRKDARHKEANPIGVDAEGRYDEGLARRQIKEQREAARSGAENGEFFDVARVVGDLTEGLAKRLERLAQSDVTPRELLSWIGGKSVEVFNDMGNILGDEITRQVHLQGPKAAEFLSKKATSARGRMGSRLRKMIRPMREAKDLALAKAETTVKMAAVKAEQKRGRTEPVRRMIGKVVMNTMVLSEVANRRTRKAVSEAKDRFDEKRFDRHVNAVNRAGFDIVER